MSELCTCQDGRPGHACTPPGAFTLRPQTHAHLQEVQELRLETYVPSFTQTKGKCGARRSQLWMKYAQISTDFPPDQSHRSAGQHVLVDSHSRDFTPYTHRLPCIR